MRSFSHYQTLDLIGPGPETVVHKAWDKGFLQREVAVKFLNEDSRTDSLKATPFLERGRILANVQSDRIVKVLEIDPNQHAIVMELAKDSLKNQIQNGPTPPKEAQSLLAQCLEGLRDIHANERLHGQIKPTNILCFPNGSYKLSDPGVFAEGALSLAPGSEKYLAPELAAKETWLKDGNFGPQMDLYQLGFCVLEAFAGPKFNQFFPGAEVEEINKSDLWWRWQASPNDCNQIIEQLADPKYPKLTAALKSLLAKPLDKRARNAEEVLDLLGKEAIPENLSNPKSSPTTNPNPSQEKSKSGGSDANSPSVSGFSFEQKKPGGPFSFEPLFQKGFRIDPKLVLASTLGFAVVLAGGLLVADFLGIFPFGDSGTRKFEIVTAPEGGTILVSPVEKDVATKAIQAIDKNIYLLDTSKKYTVNASLKGHRDYKDKVIGGDDFKRKSNVFVFKMAPLPATAEIVVNPLPANPRILLDGKQMIFSENRKVTLKPGDNRFVFEKDDWEPAELIAKFDQAKETVELQFNSQTLTPQAKAAELTVLDLRKKGDKGNPIVPEWDVTLKRKAQKYVFSAGPGPVDIEVNGKSLGNAKSIETSLEVGNHTVTFRKLGYQPQERKFSVEFDPKDAKYFDETPRTLKESVELGLAMTLGGMVDTIPSGAWVEVNGRVLEKQTPCAIDWQNGTNKIVFFKPGFQKKTESVPLVFTDLRDPGSLNRSFPLTKKDKQRVVFQIDPTDATVVFNETNKPIDLKAGLELPMGKHDLLVKKQGFRPKTLPIEIDFSRDKITDPEERIEKVTLVPTGALAFQIESDPPGASVSVNGKKVEGNTPLALSLGEPQNKIVVSKEGFEDSAVDWKVDLNSPDNSEMGKIPLVKMIPREVLSFSIAGGKMDFIKIDPKKKSDGGKFMMGTPAGERKRALELFQSEKEQIESEHPHEVQLTKEFYMGKTPVTVGQFRAFIDDTKHQTLKKKEPTNVLGYLDWTSPGFEQGPDHPVVLVSWQDAQAYCDWFNRTILEKSGKKGRVRLPTEAEWEYTCRAGSTTAFWFGDRIDDFAVYGNSNGEGLGSNGDRYKATSPVGKFKPNPWGLFDMNGNVSQYCLDYFADYPTRSQIDPKGPASGTYRVVRGGSYAKHPLQCRSGARNKHLPVGLTPMDWTTGFRLVYQESGSGKPTAPLGSILP